MTGGRPAILRRLAVILAAALPAGPCAAAQQSAEPRPRDAAEAVREGDVSEWLKYYQRERELQAPAQPPAPTAEPVAQPQQEDAATRR